MNHDGNNCKYCNRYFRFKDLHDQHVVTCEYFYRSKSQRDRDTDALETLPSAQEQYKLIQHLTLKVASMEKEMIKLKGATVSRKRKVIMEWLNSPSGPKPTTTFDLWCKATIVTFDHLTPVFNLDITDGMKSSLQDYCSKNKPIPVCAFTQKTGAIYVWSSSTEDPLDIKWRLLDATMYTRWIDRVAHRFLETFLKWQMENSHKIRATEQDKEHNISNMHKINGISRAYEERRRSELRKWIFNHIAQDFTFSEECDYV